SQIDDAHETARVVRSALPAAVLIVGGYHVSAVPEETLSRYPLFDMAVFGEGERTLREIVDAYASGGFLEKAPDIKGLCYREESKILKNAERSFIEDLDSLAFPAYQMMPVEKYVGFYNILMFPRRTLALSTGRGCPYKCIFCYKATGERYRVRSLDSVMAELEKDISEFHIRDFVVTDESFIVGKERVAEFCERILRNRINRKVNWICQSRVDHADYELFKLMKKAGCRVIAFGIESGNQEILKKIKKGITLEQAKKAVSMSRRAGILTDTNFILGHPWDTRETIEQTVSFSRELNADLTSFSLLVPFPGTIIADMAREGTGGLKIMTDDYSKYGKQVGGALELEDIPRKEMEKMQIRAYLLFFMRPSKILKLLRVVSVKMLLLMAWHVISPKKS
ncbi:MAG TPA: radical SAM protein, partial [bacterium]|nr:radical SAM protein [bacterium]